MRWEQRIAAQAEAWPEIVARLRRRPGTWIKAFLLLATPELGHGDDRSRRVWMRLEQPGEDTTARLWWRPYGDGDLFDRFVGEIGLRREGDEMWIWVEGTAEGGTAERAERTLRSLVSLLAAALAEVSARDT
jgi:hypothetical protein